MKLHCRKSCLKVSVIELVFQEASERQFVGVLRFFALEDVSKAAFLGVEVENDVHVAYLFELNLCE